MTEALHALRRQRLVMLLTNLAYFVVLLILGIFLFLKNAGGSAAMVLVVLVLAGYLLLVRPRSRKYLAAVRKELLHWGVCGELESWTYHPNEGVPAAQVQETGLVQTTQPKAFSSRQHITGKMGSMSVEAADVTFPVLEEGLNAMFSGLFVQLSWPGARFPALEVRRGDWKSLKLTKQQQESLEALGGFIPGSLYLRTEGEKMTVMLRGRFLGFRINPLMQLSESVLTANPVPEVMEAVRFARLMRMSQQ